MPANPQKQLHRLPQVFGKVLDLPLQSSANVKIEERSNCFSFIADIENDAFSGQVRAHAVKIYPEVMKVVVKGGNGGRESDLLLEKPEVDRWRFRLPETTRPELTTDFIIGKELIVMMPKGEPSCSHRPMPGLKMAMAQGSLYLYSKPSS